MQVSGEPGSQTEGAVWMVGILPRMLWGLLASDQYLIPSDCLLVTSVPHRATMTSFSVVTVPVFFTDSDTDWAGNVVIICLNALCIWHRLKNKTECQVKTKISALGLIKVIRECGQ